MKIENTNSSKLKKIGKTIGRLLWKLLTKIIIPNASIALPVIGVLILAYMICAMAFAVISSNQASAMVLDSNDVYYVAIQEAQEEHSIEGTLDASLVKAIDYIRDDVKEDTSKIKEMLMEWYVEKTQAEADESEDSEENQSEDDNQEEGDSEEQTKEILRWKSREDIIAMLTESPFNFSEKDLTDLEEILQESLSESDFENGNTGDLPPETGGYIYPVPTHTKITSHYGWRNLNGAKNFHGGTDFGCPEGTPVVASKSGIVIQTADLNDSYGKCVRIRHDDGVVTLYAHNSAYTVSVGDRVKQGQQIAKAGNTGRSFGSHCHFEIRINGTRVNPESYL